MNKNLKTLKVAITGAHGVGKTTLANQLKKELSKLNITASVLEVPRYICSLADDKEFLRRGHNNPLKQALVLLGQAVKESSLSHDKSIQVQICDRTILDHWAYTLLLFNDSFCFEKVDLIYESFILEHYKSYDVVFYYPIERSPVDDGVRESDVEFQVKVDERIFELLKKHNLPFIHISSLESGYVENMMTTIISNI